MEMSYETAKANAEQAEMLFIPRDQTPKGAVPETNQKVGKKFKKQYIYGFNDVWLNLYTDGSAICDNLANSTSWYFANANDAFNYAKQIAQRSKILGSLLG